MTVNPAFLAQRMNMFNAAQSFQAWFQYAANMVAHPHKMAPFTASFTAINVSLVDVDDDSIYGPRGTILPFANAYYRAVRDSFLDTAREALEAQPTRRGLEHLQEFVDTIRASEDLDAELLDYMDNFAPHPEYVKALAECRERNAQR